MGVYSLSKSGINNWSKFSNVAASNGQTSNFELIATQLVTSPVTSVSFTNLQNYSQYKHLQIRCVAIGATDDVLKLTFNGDTLSNYSSHTLLGEGVAARSQSFTSQTAAQLQGGWYGTGNIYPSPFIADILDPFSTTKNKTIRSFCGTFQTSSIMQVALVSAAWYSQSAVTSIQIKMNAGGNFAVGSRFSLYGVK